MQGIPAKVLDLIKEQTDLKNENSGISSADIREKLNISSEKCSRILSNLKAQYLIKTRVNDERKRVHFATTRAIENRKDRSKYIFEGKMYSKPKFVWAIVSAYVRDNKPTLKELKQAFPDRLHSMYGVAQEVKEAVDLQKNFKRFYLKDEELLNLKGGVKAAVCSDWGTNNMVGFLNHLEEHDNFGYKFHRESNRQKIKQIQDERRRKKARERAKRLKKEKATA